MSRIEVVPINRVAVTAFVICAGAGAVLSGLTRHPAPAIAGGLIGVYLLFAIKVVQQWEKVALLRLGVTLACAAGIFHVVPVFETISNHIDQRVRVHSVTAESTLTATRFR